MVAGCDKACGPTAQVGPAGREKFSWAPFLFGGVIAMVKRMMSVAGLAAVSLAVIGWAISAGQAEAQQVVIRQYGVGFGVGSPYSYFVAPGHVAIGQSAIGPSLINPGVVYPSIGYGGWGYGYPSYRPFPYGPGVYSSPRVYIAPRIYPPRVYSPRVYTAPRVYSARPFYGGPRYGYGYYGRGLRYPGWGW